MSDANVTRLARTLDQELLALARGASLECPVCSEFVLHVRSAHASAGASATAGTVIACPECRSILVDGHEVPELQLPAALPATVT